MAGFAAIYIIWGSTYLAIRVAVETMPPLLMAGGRFIVAGILLGTVLKASARFHATWQQWRDNIVIGAFMLLGGNGLVVWAEQQVPSGIATLVISLNPIFIVLAEWLIAAGLLQMFSKKSSKAVVQVTQLCTATQSLTVTRVQQRLKRKRPRVRVQTG